MSNKLLKAYNGGSGSPSTTLHSPQSCWMSRWTQAPSKQQRSLVAPHSLTWMEEGMDHKQECMRKSLNISSDLPRSYESIRNNTQPETSGLKMGVLTIKAENIPFCFLGDSRNMENTYIRTPMVFKRDLSNNDFGSLDQGNGDPEKYSAIVVHKGSSFSPFLSENNFEDLQNSCQADGENMRICTAVDSGGSLNGRTRLYSKTTEHHVLFTSQTGVVPESAKHKGVRIQPLWSSTDSEKDNFGDAETPRCERSFDLSAETGAMNVASLPVKEDSPGMLFRLMDKSQSTMIRDKTLETSSSNPLVVKLSGKLPPGTTSLDAMETSTSRTQSLETEHLLYCAEQPSKSKPFPHFDECALQEEPSCRRLKRLKTCTTSSKVEESSLHGKTHINTTSPDAPSMDHIDLIKESLIPSQNVAPINGESSQRTKKDPIFQSSWIRRWCQDRNSSKSGMLCEPDTSKLAMDELEKKQFPSIAALALMGKSFDGFHACKYTKRGPLVVWSSEDY